MSDRFSRVALDESSGPVSPRFQYSLHVEISAGNGGGATLAFDHKTPKGRTGGTFPITAERYGALCDELSSRVGESVDLVGDMRHRKGISFNVLEVVLGAATTRVDYLLTHLEDGAHANLVAAVDAIKKLVSEVEASSAPSTAP